MALYKDVLYTDLGCSLTEPLSRNCREVLGVRGGNGVLLSLHIAVPSTECRKPCMCCLVSLRTASCVPLHGYYPHHRG